MLEFDNRILSYYSQIKDLNKGIFTYPRFLALYPTNKCQFNCTFCDYKELNSGPKKELSISEWKHILDTCKNIGVEGIGLSGGGEPLMLSTIEEFLEYAFKLGFKIGLVTNGLLINKRLRPELYKLLFNCSFIRVSFESGSAQEFKRIKGSDYFNHILRNISEFIKDKPEKLQVSYKYTITSNIYSGDIKQAIRIADDVGFYSIQFKSVANSSLNLDLGKKEYIKEIIDSITPQNTKIIIDFDHFTKCDKECKISTIQTLIDYYGDIYICCYYRHRPDEMKIGNIFEKSFESIWGSAEHKYKISNIDPNKCNLYDCRYIRYDLIMKDLISKDYFSFI
jgi:MoaA/NifB/PqqE/SkfB family radical SAM enzyme